MRFSTSNSLRLRITPGLAGVRRSVGAGSLTIMIAALQRGGPMALIAPETIYTKTAKGILEIRNKTVRLSRELGLVFLSVDGKASVGDLLPRSGMSPVQFSHALNTLVTD